MPPAAGKVRAACSSISMSGEAELQRLELVDALPKALRSPM
jgi:hypothetical protein